MASESDVEARRLSRGVVFLAILGIAGTLLANWFSDRASAAQARESNKATRQIAEDARVSADVLQRKTDLMVFAVDANQLAPLAPDPAQKFIDATMAPALIRVQFAAKLPATVPAAQTLFDDAANGSTKVKFDNDLAAYLKAALAEVAENAKSLPKPQK